MRNEKQGVVPRDRRERDRSQEALVRKRILSPPPPERGGSPGPEPTRYGDWERGGRCTDFLEAVW